MKTLRPSRRLETGVCSDASRREARAGLQNPQPAPRGSPGFAAAGYCRRRFQSAALIGLALLAGCAGQPDSTKPTLQVAQADTAASSAMAPMASEAASAKSDAEPIVKAPALPRKIIFTGEVTLVCEDLDKAAAGLEARAKEFGGYISNANQTGARGATREGSWTVRIAAEKFDAFLKALPALGELQSSSRKADDVSEEFYDVAARLKNKKIEEARLIDLLQKATGKLTEVLTVEKELSRVRDEIERIEGRLRFLTNQTDLSTITITLREVKNFVPEGPPTLATQVSRSFTGSLDALKSFVVGVLLLAVALVPWAVPLAAVALLAFRVLKKRR